MELYFVRVIHGFVMVHCVSGIFEAVAIGMAKMGVDPIMIVENNSLYCSFLSAFKDSKGKPTDLSGVHGTRQKDGAYPVVLPFVYQYQYC